MGDSKTARDGLDLRMVFASVVSPVLAELFDPGELESAELDWREIRIPVVPDRVAQSGVYVSNIQFGEIDWTTEVNLVLDLTAVGEHFSFYLATPETPLDQIDLPSISAELYSQIQDFIAESSFGWGQLRGPR